MNAHTKPSSVIPFDAVRLDRLMDEAGIDVLVATSKHNVQYLLGGHRAFFFDYMDAMGVSRYLPAVIYAKGASDKAAFQIVKQSGDFGMAVEEVETPGENQMVHMIDDFAAAVREGREPYPNPDEAVKTLKVMDALRRSAAEGKEVNV